MKQEISVTKSTGAQMESLYNCDEDDAIAVIGMAFEFAQDAVTEESFWQMLVDGRSASTTFPHDRLNIDAYYHPDGSRPSTLPFRGGHFVKEHLGSFDAPFFAITPAEAACMDPQHRRLLEVSYHALENAGLPLAEVCGSNTSVYTGCFTNDYMHILARDPEAEQPHALLGVGPSLLANRISWFFDLKGPSMNLDSACSSSLMAFHLACQDLRSGSASMALVGGANYIYHPDLLKMMANFNFLSPDSRSWSFDERANGYGRGEGIACMVLKRVSDACRDGDVIRAVIRNTGSNQDGRTPSITQPSQEAQIDLIQRTYREAKLDMRPTRFFEAHGTGTPVGDPIEATAIGRAFADYRSAEDPLYIGAVKANIGHLEGASGIAGIIKAVLVLEKGIIPPICGLRSLNHRIDESLSHLCFPKESLRWPSRGPRRACVSSFGFGGTNAMAILDDACHYLRTTGLKGFHRTVTETVTKENEVCVTETQPAPSFKLLIWSAMEKSAVSHIGRALRLFTTQHPEMTADLAYSLVAKRSHFSWRNFEVVDQDVNTSSDDTPLGAIEPVKASHPGTIAFVFTGQGAQYVGMYRGLSAFPVFRATLAVLDNHLKNLGCQWSLCQMVDGGLDHDTIDQPDYSQILTTCLQIALVDLFRSFGISPTLVMGHSSGEIAAAYAVGALCRFSAVKVAYWRGVLSAKIVRMIAGLGMMAVGLSQHEVQPYLDAVQRLDGTLEVVVGCINSPRSVTLTGRSSQLSIIASWLKRDAVFSRTLQIPVAYHSPFMATIVEEYQSAIRKLLPETQTSPILMFSSVNGTIVNRAVLYTAEYWTKNLVSPVQFEAAFSQMIHHSKRPRHKQLGRKRDDSPILRHILEIGPHGTLRGPIRDCLQKFESSDRPSYLSSLKRGAKPAHSVLQVVGTLYCHAYPVNILAANDLLGTHKPVLNGMPSYPFNHEQRYWNESRFSRNMRFRKNPRHDLIGVPSEDWNPHNANWRNVIRLREVLWLKDHQVNGEVILPAAGMIAMAIKALSQLSDKEEVPESVQMHSVQFLRPVSFSNDTKSVEIQLNLSAETSVEGSKWKRFRLFNLEQGDYMECCRGYILAIPAERGLSQFLSACKFLDYKSYKQWAQDLKEACEERPHDPYQLLKESGSKVYYGPAFQNIERMHLGCNGEAIAILNTKSWKACSQIQYSDKEQHRIHPTTLDGLAQVVVPTLAHMNKGRLSTMVPSRVDKLWIDLRSSSRNGIRVAAKCNMRNRRGATADMVATSLEGDQPLVCFEGLETIFIDSHASGDTKIGGKERDLCTQLSWKLDIDLMSSSQVPSYCLDEDVAQPDGFADFLRNLKTIIMVFVHEALDFFDSHSFSPRGGHWKTYFEWMRYQVSRSRECYSDYDVDVIREILKDKESRAQMIAQVESFGIWGEFFTRIGGEHIDILKGTTDALDFMFRSGLVDLYYEAMLSDEYRAASLVKYLDLLSFKRPSMNILEIGAGTGGQTVQVLKALSSGGVRRWATYDYTDLSPSFFDRARKKFKDHSTFMSYKILDISKDPVEQGFAEHSYDVILAGQVVHATANISQTLQNIRMLLKPGGKLILVELTVPESLFSGFAFGLLPDWWKPLSSDTRSYLSPCLSVEQWDQRLSSTGFSGVDIEFFDRDDLRSQHGSILISSATMTTEPSTECEHRRTAIVYAPKNQAQLSIAKVVKENLQNCDIYTLEDSINVQLPPETFVIFLLEVESDFIDGMSEITYEMFKHIMLRHRDTLWVTKTTHGSGIWPQHHLADGFGRALSSEDAHRKFVTLTLDRLQGGDDELARHILDVRRQTIRSPVQLLENNYLATSGALKIGRITKLDELNKELARINSDYYFKQTQLGPETRLALTLQESDSEGSLSLQYNEPKIDQEPGVSELVVEVKAFGLTHRDALILSAKLEADALHIPITECAGVVRATGTSTRFKQGDRVCLLVASSVQTRICVHQDQVFPIPDEMSFVEAASLPVASWLCYHTLSEICRLQRGDNILISRANSAFGQVAIQMATRLGANVHATSTSTLKRELLSLNLDMSEQSVMHSEDPMILESIRQVTKGAGYDAIICCARTASESRLQRALAPLGHFVDLCLEPRLDSERQNPARLPVKNASYIEIDMAATFRYKPGAAFRTFQKAMETVFSMRLKPPQPIRVFKGDEVDKAVRSLKDMNSDSKIVVEWNHGSNVLVNTKTVPSYQFPSTATYLIAGGLGGLGRCITRWMVGRGARNIILLSRSGARSPPQVALIEELEQQGVRCETPILDIGNLHDLNVSLERLQDSGMPPIRGCIQATAVIRDNPFEKMSYEDWHVSTNSKVTGSWNLHQALLSHDLDFFILLSSIGGIYGARAQANYAAGNTFKDALARHRVSRGLKAVSIDLGFMVEEGIVAETEFLMTATRRVGILMEMTTQELTALLDYYCNPSLPVLPESEAQVLTGLELPAVFMARGVDVHSSMRRPIASHLFRMEPINKPEGGTSAVPAIPGTATEMVNRARQFTEASSIEEATNIVTGWLLWKLTHLLGLSELDIDPQRPLHTYGIDSLVAIDLRTWIQQEIGADITSFELLSNRPLEELSAMAVGRSRHRQENQPKP